MRTQIALLSSLVALGAMAPLAAFAQEPEGPQATEPAPPPEPVLAPAQPPAAPAEAGGDPAPMPGWIRIDSDGLGLQLWGGGTYPLADSVGLAFDMYAAGSYGELDVGPAITAGPFTITPMLGLNFNWAAHRAASLVPQLFVTGGPDPIYGELWVQYFMNKVFNDTPSNQLYVRLFADYKLNQYIALGPQLELWHDSEADPGLFSLPIGGNVMLSNVGAGGTFLFFLGYETKDTFDDNHVGGRLTFVYNF